MSRSALAGPTCAAVVAVLALCLAGCGSGSRHTTSGPAGSSTTSGSGSGSSTTTTTTTTTSAGPGPGVPGGRLTVTPAGGHPTSSLRFTLQALTSSGRHGQSQLSYTLGVSGPQGSGCVAEHATVVAVTHAQQPVTVSLGPAQLGGRWCAGSYTARVDELARPVCAPAQVCPQFIRVVAAIGPVHFRITP
jgi:hypothetical protein